MANYTTNYNLKKPLTSELFTVNDANGNMDLVDTELKNLEDNKVDKVTGKSLVSDTEITKLLSVESGAEVNNISDAQVLDLTDGNETTLHKHNATNTPFTPTGKLSSTNVQNALVELDTEKASKEQEVWITPTLLNGWAHESGSSVRYYKDTLGYVHVKGIAKDGTSTIFNFPVGYKPDSLRGFAGMANGTARVTVNSIGNLTAYSYSGPVYLDCVSFKAEV